MISHVEQDEDDGQHDGNHDLEALFCPDLILILAAPLDVVTGRHGDSLCDNAFCFIDEPADIASTNVHQNGPAEKAVFTRDHRRSHDDPNGGNLSKGYLCAVGPGNQHVSQFLDVFTEVSCIANADGEPLAALNRERQVLPANGSFDDVLSVTYRDAVTCRSCAIDLDFEIG